MWTWIIDQVKNLGLTDLFEIVPGIFGAWAAWRIYKWNPARTIKRTRNQFVLKPIESEAPSRISALQRREALQQRLQQIVANPQSPIQAEIQWLSELCSRSLGINLSDNSSKKYLLIIADGYARIHEELISKSFLGLSLTPLLETDAKRAYEVELYFRKMHQSEMFSSNLLATEFHTVPDKDNLPPGRIKILASCSPQLGILSLDLFTRYTNRTKAVRLSDNQKPESVLDDFFDANPIIVKNIKNRLNSPGIFDGKIARLANDVALERNTLNGRVRMRIHLEKTTYSSWLADNNLKFIRNSYAKEGIPLSSETYFPQGMHSRQLAASILVETNDGFLVLTERSNQTDINNSLLMPSANGNVQFDDTFSADGDLDEQGMPSLLRTMSRELIEEIGVEAPPEDIIVIGLGTFFSYQEAGTNLIVGLYKSTLSIKEVTQKAHNVHPASGRWEVGNTLRGFKIKEMRAAPEEALKFIRTEPSLTNHARVALSLALFQSADLIVDKDDLTPPQENHQFLTAPYQIDY